MIGADAILGVVPTCSLGWAVALTDAMPQWGITTRPRAEMFLAQCAHESAGFTRFVENLNYSAQGLMRTWPNRFPTFEVAAQYERQPEKIANFVYANRLGNGNEASGDGWKYRGRGAIQLTGHNNYTAAGAAIRYPLGRYPQDLEQPQFGAPAACWFWKSRGLNELADEGDFEGITRRINGGLVGLTDRIAWWHKFQGA